MSLLLHGYWRSTASYRVRIALNFKGLAYDQAAYDLRTGAQRAPAYLALGPQGLVPTLVGPDGPMIQSLAILEWIEERWPTPALLPADPAARMIARPIAAVVASDIHPLNNLRVLTTLREQFAATPDQVQNWIARWIVDGFDALERIIRIHSGVFAVGDELSIADCALVPQLYSAERFGVDLQPFPDLRRVCAAALALPAVAAAHPARQPDADTE